MSNLSRDHAKIRLAFAVVKTEEPLEARERSEKRHTGQDRGQGLLELD